MTRGPLGKRRVGPTREALRFKWLIEQCEANGINQSEFARLTGIEASSVNKLRNLESSGRSEIGASIIRRVMNGLKVDPAYFFSEYDGPKDHRLFLLSAKRDENRVSALEESARKRELDAAQLGVELAHLRAEVVQLRQELNGTRGGTSATGKKRIPG